MTLRAVAFWLMWCAAITVLALMATLWILLGRFPGPVAPLFVSLALLSVGLAHVGRYRFALGTSIVYGALGFIHMFSYWPFLYLWPMLVIGPSVLALRYGKSRPPAAAGA